MADFLICLLAFATALAAFTHGRLISFIFGIISSAAGPIFCAQLFCCFRRLLSSLPLELLQASTGLLSRDTMKSSQPSKGKILCRISHAIAAAPCKAGSHSGASSAACQPASPPVTRLGFQILKASLNGSLQRSMAATQSSIGCVKAEGGSWAGGPGASQHSKPRSHAL